MIELIQQHRQAIEELCKRMQIKKLEVFGSAATGDFDPNVSDIDFIVEFSNPQVPPGLLSRYLSLAEELEHILGRKVDVITPAGIRNPRFREAVNASRQAVYAA